MAPKIVFFRTPAGLRAWFEKNHDTAAELHLGLHKKGSGKPSVTWPESVDEALCFGWIDGVRHGIDENSYTNRLTPRRPKSNWSAINIERVAELEEAGQDDGGRPRRISRARPEQEQSVLVREQAGHGPFV